MSVSTYFDQRKKIFTTDHGISVPGGKFFIFGQNMLELIPFDSELNSASNTNNEKVNTTC
jgi:hypothetical protein